MDVTLKEEVMTRVSGLQLDMNQSSHTEEFFFLKNILLFFFSLLFIYRKRSAVTHGSTLRERRRVLASEK